MPSTTITVSASDIIAMIGARARAICAACDAHAVGSPMPSADAFDEMFEDMERLSRDLRTMQAPSANKSAA